MTIDAVLERMQLIFERYEWVKGDFAQDAQGMFISPYAKAAYGFCLAGCAKRAIWELMGSPETALTETLPNAFEVSEGFAESLKCVIWELERFVEDLTHFNDRVAEDKIAVLETVAEVQEFLRRESLEAGV